LNRLKTFFSRILYVQLSPQRLSVRDPARGRGIAEVPELAIEVPPDGKARRVLAVGQQARGLASMPSTIIVNPFTHPRSLVSDFTCAEQVLKAFVKKVVGRAWLQPQPLIVMHPLGEHEGGLTQIELRAIRELGLGAGGARVLIWLGPELSDEELQSRQFLTSGWCLAD
jgi:rod shape-determining protein MreB and related proteins